MRWVAYAAAIWAFIFGVFHTLWALGWYVGLDPVQARVAFSDAVTQTYNLCVIGACALGTAVSLGFVMPWGRRIPLRLLAGTAWIGSALLVLRAGASLVQAGYYLATDQFTPALLGGWEPWFLLGAVLFSVTTWRFGRREVAQR